VPSTPVGEKESVIELSQGVHKLETGVLSKNTYTLVFGLSENTLTFITIGARYTLVPSLTVMLKLLAKVLLVLSEPRIAVPDI
jgi:hypothetical protein